MCNPAIACTVRPVNGAISTPRAGGVLALSLAHCIHLKLTLTQRVSSPQRERSPDCVNVITGLANEVFINSWRINAFGVR